MFDWRLPRGFIGIERDRYYVSLKLIIKHKATFRVQDVTYEIDDLY